MVELDVGFVRIKCHSKRRPLETITLDHTIEFDTIDGLEIGTYMLGPKPFSVPGVDPDAVSIIIPIVDDYLFGQDLELPIEIESGGEADGSTESR